MCKRMIGLLVAVTFLVAVSAEPAHARKKSGGKSGAVAGAVVVTFLLGIITLGGIFSLKAQQQREQTNQMAIDEAHKTQRISMEHRTAVAAGATFAPGTNVDTDGSESHRVIRVSGRSRHASPPPVPGGRVYTNPEPPEDLEGEAVPERHSSIRPGEEVNITIKDVRSIYLLIDYYDVVGATSKERYAFGRMVLALKTDDFSVIKVGDPAILRQLQGKFAKVTGKLSDLEQAIRLAETKLRARGES